MELIRFQAHKRVQVGRKRGWKSHQLWRGVWECGRWTPFLRHPESSHSHCPDIRPGVLEDEEENDWVAAARNFLMCLKAWVTVSGTES